jgi:signal transduction histidine kinase
MPAQFHSIRRKVVLFSFLICFTVLLTAGGFLFYHHIVQTRQRLAESLRTVAQMTAANASVALAFSHFEESSKVIQSLKHDPLIVSAVLYKNDGLPFVSYGAPVPEDVRTALLDPNEAILVDVKYDSQIDGSLLIITDNRAELHRTVATGSGVYVGALLVTGVLATVLATLFQRSIARPLSGLARTAADVTAKGDYSTRATPEGPAEVAALAEAFNTMLAEIGRRDAELARQLTALDEEMHNREAAEASLRQNTRDLLRLSHEAGMAEVATGVLHNIGNALNSINVSAELLADHLRARAQASSTTLREFFRAPPPRALPVFTSHADGSDVLAFAAALSTHAADSLDAAAHELSSLRTGVAHLKDIVSRQQSLAKSVRHNETFDLREAVEESLLLDKTAAHSSLPGLRIEQSREGCPFVYADRSAVVQILVNLLANARAALTQTVSPRLGIRIGPPTATHQSVALIDNGVGIPADQLVSIFSYGFTTKAGGHGFGLHNAANTARFMGGSLRVFSEGPGLGATFTLELPLPSPSLSSSAHEA